MPSITLVNPRRRRKARRSPKRRRKAIRPRARKSAAPRRRRRAVRRGRRMVVRRKSNPIGGLSTAGILSTAKSAAVGASGAVALDVVFGMLPLPESLKTGPMSLVAKAGSAVLLGYGVGKVAGRATGAQMTEGALTIILYRVIKDQVAKFAPTLVLGEYVSGMGEYVSGLGYLTPGLPMNGLPTGFGNVAAPANYSMVPAGFSGVEDDDPWGLNG